MAEQKIFAGPRIRRIRNGKGLSQTAMAQGLGIRTVAEYVQDQPSLECVRELGVDYAQGTHIGPPRPLLAA